MIYDYSHLLATANRLIERFGREETIERVVKSGDPWNPTTTTESYAVTLVEVDYNTISDRPATLIEVGDRTGLIAMNSETEPVKSDKITLTGQTYGFYELEPLQPGNTKMFYRFVARK